MRVGEGLRVPEGERVNVGVRVGLPDGEGVVVLDCAAAGAARRDRRRRQRGRAHQVRARIVFCFLFRPPWTPLAGRVREQSKSEASV